MLDQARTSIEKSDYDAAERFLEHASALLAAEGGLASNWLNAYRVMDLKATLHANRGEFDEVASVLAEYVTGPSVTAAHPGAFFAYNALCLVHQVREELLAAFVACEAMTAAGQAGTWGDADFDRVELTSLKAAWHQAYLLRMYAQQLPQGGWRSAVIARAEAARAEYTRLARPLENYGDSIAVLEVFFAVHDGDKPRALAAARQVNSEENEDLEDLYLTYMGLRYGGGAQEAARIREKLESASGVWLVTPLIQELLRKDLANETSKEARHWTPRYAAAVKGSGVEVR